MIQVQVAPHLTTLINGAGWNNAFPRIMSTQDMVWLISTNPHGRRLVAIQDVTCDIKVILIHYGMITSHVF